MTKWNPKLEINTCKILPFFKIFAHSCLKNYPFFLIPRLSLKKYPFFAKMGTTIVYALVGNGVGWGVGCDGSWRSALCAWSIRSALHCYIVLHVWDISSVLHGRDIPGVLHISALCLVQAWSYTLLLYYVVVTLQRRHNERDGVSNHQLYDCVLKHLFRRRSKKTSKLCVTGLCEGNSPVTGEFPTQRANNVENVSIQWRHHIVYSLLKHP